MKIQLRPLLLLSLPLLLARLWPTAAWAQYEVHRRAERFRLVKPARLYLSPADTTRQAPALRLAPGDTVNTVGHYADQWIVITHPDNQGLRTYYVPQAALLGAWLVKRPKERRAPTSPH